MYKKVYVEVLAYFDTEGNIEPVSIIWEDGRIFEIDRVTDKRRAASLKAGGAGMRYTIKVKGKERYIWLEENRWFLEVYEEPQPWNIN